MLILPKPVPLLGSANWTKAPLLAAEGVALLWRSCGAALSLLLLLWRCCGAGIQQPVCACVPVLMQVTAADELAQGVDAVQQAVSNIERFGKSEWLRAPRWLWGRASMRKQTVWSAAGWLQRTDGEAAAKGGAACM